MRRSQITNWCHEIIRSQIPTGGVYVDATMGNGHDTLFFREMAGEHGKVVAFDIQEAALDATRKRLESHGFTDHVSLITDGSACSTNISLILDGHEHMDRYVDRESADVICFNFGYLPGGDHNICTKIGTDLPAIKTALSLLKKGGVLSLCIYSGGDTGFEEKEAILDFLKTLPSREYTVIVNQYHNRENHPPIPVFVWKEV